ncbi:MAG: T9SS type A sorting domain-containing protein [Flavobacteriaceae bacterium]|nr:T9SS type A sorting domain-containing protein [Flavobacteriaceae bacterium]NQY08159.1 T9SS type A sorting domain-containing protein [Flavobacteriales bacterium]
MSAYPNPNAGTVNINLGQLTNVAISVYSGNGKLVYQQNNINSPIHQFKLEGSAGLYIIEITSEGKTQEFKLVKE